MNSRILWGVSGLVIGGGVFSYFALPHHAMAGPKIVAQKPVTMATPRSPFVLVFTEHKILPNQTDPAITDPNRQEYAYAPTGNRENGELLIFFPGSHSEPGDYSRIMAEGVSLGYHVIGVDYPNSQSMHDMCGNDLDCYAKARREVFEGGDYSSVVAVNANNSIRYRLLKLLAYLNTTYPTESWGDFLQNGKIQWGKTALAGHSQGSGFAAYIAKTHNVARVAMFSGVDDANSVPTSAHWITATHLTPIKRYYGFAHTQDTTFYPGTRANWKTLGVDALGAAQYADAASPPYGHSHELISSTMKFVDAATHGTIIISNPHNATAADNATPVLNGVPCYRNAWRYVLGP
ncbi:hypothetical protein IAD21_04498 [Abditibacteriota bacterium]|nr:hypothetical protein IAD21_04498 [Abditibacteriota bacterium]